MRDLGNGEAFEGEYVTRSQLEGRVHFVSWINAGQGRELWRLLKGFQWHVVEREADSRGLVASRTLMVKASPLPKSTPAAMPQTRPISACRLGR
jgi:hypothetical protein